MVTMEKAWSNGTTRYLSPAKIRCYFIVSLFASYRLLTSCPFDDLEAQDLNRDL